MIIKRKLKGIMAHRDNDYVLDLTKLAFYKKYFGKLLTALIVSVIVIGILVAGFIIVKSQKVEREYFGIDSQSGRMVPLVPLGDPYLAQGALLTWFVECVTSTNTYDFVNYQKQFQKNSQCFTGHGWDEFNSAVARAGTLESVKTQRLVASSVANGAPVITREGLRGGVYSWEIEMPVMATFQGGQAGRSLVTQKLLVTAVVSRVPTYESRNGVGIDHYVAQEK